MPVIAKRGKPCPFCGSSDLSFNLCAIRCDKCGARGPVAVEQPQAALKVWNERYYKQQLIELV